MIFATQRTQIANNQIFFSSGSFVWKIQFFHFRPETNLSRFLFENDFTASIARLP